MIWFRFVMRVNLIQTVMQNKLKAIMAAQVYRKAGQTRPLARSITVTFADFSHTWPRRGLCIVYPFLYFAAAWQDSGAASKLPGISLFSGIAALELGLSEPDT